MPKIRVTFEVEVPYGLMEAADSGDIATQETVDAIEELEGLILDEVRANPVGNWDWVTD